MNRCLVLPMCLLLSILTPGPSPVQGALFTGLGDLPGGAYESGVERTVKISGDGMVVVGNSRSILDVDAFRWTFASGMQPLGSPPLEEQIEPQRIRAKGVSDDGGVIVGTITYPLGQSFGIQSYRWTAEEGMEILDNAGLDRTTALTVSADGAVVAGHGGNRDPDDLCYCSAITWPDTSRLVDMGRFFNGNTSVRALSNNGTIMAGNGSSGLFQANSVWRWTEETGPVEMATEDRRTFFVTVDDMTPNGSVIVGHGGGGEYNPPNSFPSVLPYRWTEDSGLVYLDWNPQVQDTIEDVAVSDDGIIIVGSSPYGSDRPHASFIWDEALRVRDLREVLESEYGLAEQLDGWQDVSVQDISGDGSRIVGSGRNPSGFSEAWIAILKESGITGDFDEDGDLDVDDIGLMSDQIRGINMNPVFDLNSDSLLNEQDRESWVKDLKMTWFGDANLDGEFNNLDVVTMLQAGKFGTGSFATWAEGDFSGNGLFDANDVVLALQDGGYNRGTLAALKQVPEPMSLIMLITGLVIIAAYGRRWRR